MKKIPVSIVFFLIFSSCTANEMKEVVIRTSQKNISVSVDIADSEEKRRQGLMFKSSLAEKEGMLFVFPEEQKVSFWMKNTFIPLDMIFINKDKKIVAIEKNALPCKNDPCSLYSSSQKVMYVLEVNGGFAEKNMIKEGDFIQD